MRRSRKDEDEVLMVVRVPRNYAQIGNWDLGQHVRKSIDDRRARRPELF